MITKIILTTIVHYVDYMHCSNASTKHYLIQPSHSGQHIFCRKLLSTRIFFPDMITYKVIPIGAPYLCGMYNYSLNSLFHILIYIELCQIYATQNTILFSRSFYKLSIKKIYNHFTARGFFHECQIMMKCSSLKQY